MTTQQLVQLMQEQLTLQREQMESQQRQYQQQLEEQRQQMEILVTKLGEGPRGGTSSTNCFPCPCFEAFDPSLGLWTDYDQRFITFLEANSIPDYKQAHVFLTNQSPVTYKLLSNLASQKTPAKDINQLTMK